jgi:hypothetical protein
MSEYWVYTWLDSNGIRTLDELKRTLSKQGALGELKQAADLVIEAWRSSPVEARPLSLIAGAGIDLSGRLDCNHSKCRRAQVDRLFRRAWHYFPTIVARDAIAEDLTLHRNCSDDEVRERLLPHFETALIVREYDAEPLVEFLPRVPACFRHWRHYAKEAGIEDIASREAEFVEQLLAATDVALRSVNGGVLCTLDNHDFSHTQWVDLTEAEIRGKTKKQIKRKALERVARKFLVHLSADVSSAKIYGGAFGSSIPIFGKLLANRGEGVGNVAFEVGLPALDGLSVAQLIDVRIEYADSFTRFRKRLQSFLEECIRQGVSKPSDIRAKLRSDLIEKELNELKSSLEQAEQALRRKSGYALSLSILTTVIGATSGIVTPAVAFGLAATVAAGSLSPGVSKYIDDTTRIKSDEMYFLLQAEAHRH